MCSRFENKETGQSIFEKFDKDYFGNFILDENEELKKIAIAPTDDITIIRMEEGMYKIQKSQWGIKFDDDQKKPLIFNSRIETIIQKNYWNRLFENNRCLIPVTGFYEWKQSVTKKIPQRISLDKEYLFFILGIFAVVKGTIMSSLITTEPNEFMKPVHNRMPAITTYDKSLDFLNSTSDIALSMCRPFEYGDLMNIQIADDLIKKKI
jgi:putative SOS response-associated peptidase YedK